MNGPYLTHSEAIMAYAAKDPALATLMNHQHDCLEEAKRMAADAKDIAEATKVAIELLSQRIYSLTIAVVGALFVMGVGALASVVWQVATRGLRP